MADFDPTKEYILKETTDRFTLFPIKSEYATFRELYNISLAALWTPNEIDYSLDLPQWNKLTSDEQELLKYVLAFFAGGDGIVVENIAINLLSVIQSAEYTQLLGFQIFMEGIHNESYSLMIDTYITDSNEKSRLFQGIKNIPCVARKAKWAFEYIDSGTLPQNIIAFTIFEGVFFSSAFAVIFWFKDRNKMSKGLSLANEFIARDENIHCQTNIELYKHIQQKLSKNEVHDMFRSACDIEKDFISEAIKSPLLGMNTKFMHQYIECVADHWLVELGYSKLYNSTNPFPFMDTLGMESKTSFMEKRVSSYIRPGIIDPDAAINKFSITSDF